MENYPIVANNSENQGDGIQVLRISPKGLTHQHKYFEFVYVLKGTAIRKMSDAAVPVSAGNYYVANPRTAHGYEDIQDLEVINCLFFPEYIDRALTDCPSVSSLLTNRVLRFGVPVDIPLADRVLHDTDGSVLRIIKKMEREFTDGRTGYKEMLRCYLTQVLVHATRACETRVPHKAVTKVMEYLKAHYQEPLSLDALSQLVGYTPQYLSSLFSDKVGISIQLFLQRMRIEEACRLLTTTNLSTTDVAASVGYQDTRHFAKIFKKYENVSPREFRKTQGNNIKEGRYI